MKTALDDYALLETSGQYSDGETAQSYEVIVKFGATTLTLFDMSGQPLTHWALASLRAQSDLAEDGAMVLAPDLDSDARLILREPDMIAALRQVCPDLERRPTPRRLLRRAFIWGGGAIAAVVLIVFVLVPAVSNQLALLIPPAKEEAMGREVLTQVRTALGTFSGKEMRTCNAPDGVASLNRMTARLIPHVNSHISIKVQVLDHPMVNAFAVPGGHIVLFRGLIEAASSPEEVAGVLAHEIGHVVHRDPTRLALRSAGSVGILGMLLGDVTGGAMVVVLTEQLVQASYTQEAEANADKLAHETLAAANLPVRPFANFFDRLARENGEPHPLLSHLASHPDLASRAAKARAADRIGGAPFTPVLEDHDWVALRGICDTVDD